MPANSLNEGITNWEPIMASQLNTVGSQGPATACADFRADKDRLEQVFRANFCGGRMNSDHVAPLVVQAFETLWGQVPTQGNDYATQNAILRVLYALGSQVRFVREFLEVPKITSLNDPLNTLDLAFRDAQDTELAPSANVNPLVECIRNAASRRLGVNWHDINGNRLLSRLSGVPPVRIIERDRGAKKPREIEGVYAGQAVVKHDDRLGTEQMGRRAITVNKHAMGVQEYRLEFVGWDDQEFTAPVMIVRDVLAARKGMAITLGNLKGNLPLVKRS